MRNFGDRVAWKPFSDDSFKLSPLMFCTVGEANRAIKRYQGTERTCQRAVDIIQERFGKPFHIVKSCIDWLVDWPLLSRESGALPPSHWALPKNTQSEEESANWGKPYLSGTKIRSNENSSRWGFAGTSSRQEYSICLVFRNDLWGPWNSLWKTFLKGTLLATND